MTYQWIRNHSFIDTEIIYNKYFLVKYTVFENRRSEWKICGPERKLNGQQRKLWSWLSLRSFKSSWKLAESGGSFWPKVKGPCDSYWWIINIQGPFPLAFDWKAAYLSKKDRILFEKSCILFWKNRIFSVSPDFRPNDSYLNEPIIKWFSHLAVRSLSEIKWTNITKFRYKNVNLRIYSHSKAKWGQKLPINIVWGHILPKVTLVKFEFRNFEK